MGRNRYSKEEQAFYRAYLGSAKWRARKNARIAKAGGRCEWTIDHFHGGSTRCPRVKSLHVHHNDYSRLGAEQDGDLDVYCWFHHMIAHLLWERCTVCGGPALDNDEEAEAWLMVTLRCLNINPDSLPHWDKLPRKEYFLDEVPDLCTGCNNLPMKET